MIATVLVYMLTVIETYIRYFYFVFMLSTVESLYNARLGTLP
jgi:hypothetical protein